MTIRNDDEWDTKVRADAALRLSLCAIELVHNLTKRMGGQIDFEDAVSGMLNSESVDGLAPEHFRLEKASRELCARMMGDLALTLK